MHLCILVLVFLSLMAMAIDAEAHGHHHQEKNTNFHHQRNHHHSYHHHGTNLMGTHHMGTESMGTKSIDTHYIATHNIDTHQRQNHLLAKLNVNLNLNRHEFLGTQNDTSQYRKVYHTAAPLLAQKSVGDSLTVLLFDHVPPAYIEKLKEDPRGCAILIQEHTFGPAQRIAELLVKGTVINLNGRPITFMSADGGHTVLANGRPVTQQDINLGNNVIGHRIKGFIPPHVPEKGTSEIVPALLGGVLGVVGGLLKQVITLISGFIGQVLGDSHPSNDLPMTFIMPADVELHSLKNSYKTLGPLFAKPAFEMTIKEHMYLGSYSPLELTQMTELTNMAGQKKAIIKQDDGRLKIGETIVDPYKVRPTKNGFAYCPEFKSINTQSHPATKPRVKNPAKRSILEKAASAVGVTDVLSKVTAVVNSPKGPLSAAKDVLPAQKLPAKIKSNLPKVPGADAVKDLISTDHVRSARSPSSSEEPASSSAKEFDEMVESILPLPLPIPPSSLVKTGIKLAPLLLLAG